MSRTDEFHGTLRSWLFRILQLGIAVGALLWLVTSFELGQSLSRLTTLEPQILAAVLGLTVLEFVTRFSMWYVLLRQRKNIGIMTVVDIDLLIKFVNHLVPSKGTGHLVAPLVVRNLTGLSWTESLTLSAVNTGLYAILYALVSAASLVLLAPLLSPALLAVLAGATGIYFVVGTIVLLAGRNLEVVRDAVSSVGTLLERYVPTVGRFDGILSSIPISSANSAAMFATYTSQVTVVGPYTLGWLGTLFVIPGIRTAILFSAFGTSVSPPWVIPFALVLGYSVTVLPITPGGVGITEVSATLVFIALGVPEATAALVVLLDRTLGVYLPALLGWFPAARIDVSTVLETGAGDS